MMTTTEQVAADTTMVPAAGSGTLLDLFAEAGGFQWPILAMLLAGLMTLALASVRLMADHAAARRMRALQISVLDAADFSAALRGSGDSLYRRLLQCMIQVWRNAPLPVAGLGQEARTVLESARAAYGRTQRMVSFFSSTAGGLGLLGTLVGIYALFSAETRDAQTIFAGIAVAIVSTLLGIVVSIILELLEALLHSWASRYMERAETWAASVRYRLIALRGSASARQAVAMRQTLIVRLVDITLLLLLSLMAIASLDPYVVEPPRSPTIEEQGVMLRPLQIALMADGSLVMHDAAGTLLSLSPSAFAERVAGCVEVGIEVLADYRASAQQLLIVHKALQAHNMPTAFVVERTNKQP